MYDVKIKVKSVRGHCDAGHKVGDEFITDGGTPKGVCNFAYASIMPALTALQFGGTFPWSEDPNVCVMGCPDADNVVEFELRRMT